MEQLSEFFIKYCDLRSRIAPFKLKSDFETIKTVSIIDEMLLRAVNVDAGANTDGRFGFGTGHTLEGYMGRAEELIKSLEKGEYPLLGKFTEPGVALVDHSFVVKDGVVHLFYNRSYPCFEWDTRPTDTVGHAISTDLVNWKIEPPVISTENKAFENYQVWSPGVTYKDGVYYMYYTGVNINVAQAICLATSKDLYNWVKYDNNPVVKPGDWSNWDESHWSDCRDSMVFVDDDGTAYMYYCTSKRDANGNFGTAVGIATSKDMYNWEDCGAYKFDCCDITLESPFLLKKDGLYYLFFTNCGHGTSYAISDNPINGWHDTKLLLSGDDKTGCSANVPSCAEVFEFKGKWYISSCTRLPRFEQYLEIHEIEWNGNEIKIKSEK